MERICLGSVTTIHFLCISQGGRAKVHVLARKFCCSGAPFRRALLHIQAGKVVKCRARDWRLTVDDGAGIPGTIAVENSLRFVANLVRRGKEPIGIDLALRLLGAINA